MSNATQKEIFSEELKRLSIDVTAADRGAALNQLQIRSKGTISQYLHGIIRDNDTAASLIQFFRARIAERQKVLQT